MQVFKFGGASISTEERIRKVMEIVRTSSSTPTLLVVSAMGKTTNALEKVAETFYSGDGAAAILLFERIKDEHLQLARRLLNTTFDAASRQLLDIFTEVEWLLHDKPVRQYDYYYDQIVCSGELLSTSILSSCLNEAGIHNAWVDVRDLLRTDNNFRDAAIDWDFSLRRTRETLVPVLAANNIAMVQGFIGSTADNESTTLGREGSDYTAAVFANMLDASALTIWKDVEGVMNADPKQFPDAVFLKELNYDEVIEMAYYGAQVIHPKTIKPLQNKDIPFYVKCFLDSTLPGTVIQNGPLPKLPPIFVVKESQALLHLHTRDFSFVGERALSLLYTMLAEAKLTPNLLQTAAVKLHLCSNDEADKIEKFALSASDYFDVQVERNLTMLTIRHWNHEVVNKLTAGKRVRLLQQTPETIQMVLEH